MAIPLVWLGASVAATYMGYKLAQEDVRQKGNVGTYPGDCDLAIKPESGSIVCCGIFELFQHTGIWVDEHIVELKGNGLIRGISAARFLHQRSGDTIYVACDGNLQPLGGVDIANRAISKLYQYFEYDVLKNNCHKFVWQSVSGTSQHLTRFVELNQKLSAYFDTFIHWQPAAIHH